MDQAITEYEPFTLSLHDPETPQREHSTASFEHSLAACQMKEEAFDLEISTSSLA